MMVRAFYRILLRLHPKAFQTRFGGEMLLTFEEAQRTEGSARLLLDAVVSLFRQYFLHSRPRERFPFSTPEGTATGVLRFGGPPQPGLSLYRLAEGALVSLLLFAVVYLCIRGSKVTRSYALNGPDGNVSDSHPLTPADLATIHVDCTQRPPSGCLAATSSHSKSVALDELSDLQPPRTQNSDSHELPLPTGPYGIGRVLYRWLEPATAGTGQPQSTERGVFVWYPARAEQALAKPVASAWNYSRANQMLVETHTAENAPIAVGRDNFPVLLFYPAMNSSSAAYTTQIENLVSHGYVVASLEPFTDVRVVSFTNSQLLPFAADLRAAYRTVRDSSRVSILTVALDKTRQRQKGLAADLSFVLDKLTSANSSSRENAPFAGRLDLARIGAIGHSDGGLAAAGICSSDKRIQACVNEDGWTPDGPDPELASAQAPSKPYLWMNIPLTPPENEQLAYLHLNRREFDSLAKRSEILADEELHAFRAAAYRVTLHLPDITDDYFTDGPFVWSMLHPQGSVAERNALVIINLYTRAFFDSSLRGAGRQLLDGSVLPLRSVEVRQYHSGTR